MTLTDTYNPPPPLAAVVASLGYKVRRRLPALTEPPLGGSALLHTHTHTSSSLFPQSLSQPFFLFYLFFSLPESSWTLGRSRAHVSALLRFLPVIAGRVEEAVKEPLLLEQVERATAGVQRPQLWVLTHAKGGKKRTVFFFCSLGAYKCFTVLPQLVVTRINLLSTRENTEFMPSDTSGVCGCVCVCVCVFASSYDEACSIPSESLHILHR